MNDEDVVTIKMSFKSDCHNAPVLQPRKMWEQGEPKIVGTEMFTRCSICKKKCRAILELFYLLIYYYDGRRIKKSTRRCWG